MKRFTVMRKYVETSILEIEAESEEDALDLADQQEELFECVDSDTETWVTDVEEIEPEVKEKNYTGFGC